MASIEKRGQNSYRLVVEAGYDANGKRIKHTRTIKATGKREAEKELAKFQVEVEAGVYIAPEKMTFSAFVDEWRSKFAERELSPLTLKTYCGHLNNHVIPVIGHIRLSDIKSMHLVSLLDRLSKPGARKDGKGEMLASRTVEYIYDVMQSVLLHAKAWGLTKSNPLAGIKRPKVEKKEMEFYDEQEAQHVIAALYTEPPLWRLLCLGAIIGGFRRGELLALEWSDINFDKFMINIKKSISLTENGKAVVKDPKNESSKRIVDMPEWYMEELKAYKVKWNAEKLKVGSQWQGGDNQYVFHIGFGKPIYHSTPSQWWQRFIERHNLKYVRFHDLRHSSATILIENDAS